MATDPAFLFYSQDFLIGVSDLTMEERGQYITLLCLQHQKGPLTLKAMKLAAGEISPDVLKKFEKTPDGKFFNRRLIFEAEKRKSFCDSQRDKVKKRWKSGNTPVNTPVIPLENENVNEDVNENNILGKSENPFNWDSVKMNFFNGWQWKEKFCRDKKIEMPELEEKMNEFISDLELREEYKPLKDLKSHFVNSYNKKNGSRTHQQSPDGKTKLGTSAARIAALKKW